MGAPLFLVAIAVTVTIAETMAIVTMVTIVTVVFSEKKGEVQV